MRRFKFIVTGFLCVSAMIVVLHIWLAGSKTNSESMNSNKRQQSDDIIFKEQFDIPRKVVPRRKTVRNPVQEKLLFTQTLPKALHSRVLQRSTSQNSAHDKRNRQIAKTKVYSRNSREWNEDTDICKDLSLLHRATLKLKIGSIPIFIHDPNVDRAISKTINDKGSWEGEMVDIILDLLMKNPNAQFIDLGANLGVYSLAAAKLGRKVTAVDPLNLNIQNMCKSFEEGNMFENVTLVFNALSDTIQNVTLGKDRDNVGGTYVMENKNENKFEIHRLSDNMMM